MPSYRYLRDIKPENQAPQPPPEYSKKDKAKNWWHYHWGWVAAAAALLAVVVYFIISIVTQVNPDYTIGIVTPFSLPEELTAQLTNGLAPLLPDKNGDGKTIVAIEIYTIAPSVEEGAVSSQSESTRPTDPYTQMAGITRLSSALSSADSFIFLFSQAEAQAYQNDFQLFGKPDGTLAPAGEDINELSVAFKDCPALASLDLTYTNFNGEKVNGQQLFANYRVGLRAIAGTSAEKQKEGPENWQACRQIYQLLTARP